MVKPTTKGFFQVTVSGAGINHDRSKRFIKRLQEKVGRVYLPPGTTAVRRQIILFWASCSHRPALVGGTSRFIIITRRNLIDVAHIRGFFQWMTSCDRVLGTSITVQWMGEESEKNLLATRLDMFPNTGGFVNEAIHHHRKLIAEWGAPGRFYETDGSNPRQDPSPTTGLYPPLDCPNRELGQMGGYVQNSQGRLWLQDTLATRPFLTDEQLTTANSNPTRGMTQLVYEAWQISVDQECAALVSSIPAQFLALGAANRPTRDEAEFPSGEVSTLYYWSMMGA